MADKTNIEWTQATWSPVTGCTRVSEGCTRCYIERTPPFRMAGRRFDGDHIGATTGVQLHPERLEIPLRWRKPRRVFVCSMADLFHDQVPDEYIARVFVVMALAPRHTFQVLTKRHARMRSLLNSREFYAAVYDQLLAPWTDEFRIHEDRLLDVLFRMLEPREIAAAMDFPSDYVILGTRREQVRQAGNAVTPPAARDLVGVVAESLGVA